MYVRPKCPPKEEVLRAIRDSDWDKNKKRLSSDLVAKPYTSVSRLKILSEESIFNIFIYGPYNKRVHRPPNHLVVAAGKLSVHKIQEIARDNANAPHTLEVEEAPECYNPAHAEIVDQENPDNKIPRSTALKLVQTMEIKPAPDFHLKGIWSKLAASVKDWLSKILAGISGRQTPS